MHTKLALAVIAITAPTFMYGQNENSGPTSTELTINTNKPTPGIRPHDTEDQTVTCTYLNGTVGFTFSVPEGPASVKLREVFSNTVLSFSIDTGSDMPVHTGNLCGTYEITVTTFKNTYTGYITLL